MIIIYDCDDVIFIVTSIHKVKLTKMLDINDCKIKVSKKLSQIEKLRWTIFNWYCTNATLNKHLLVATWHIDTFKGTQMQNWKSSNFLAFLWKWYVKDFILKHLLLSEIQAREIFEKFVYILSEKIGYVKN